MFSYAIDCRFPRKPQEPIEAQSGMGVAQFTAIAFVPTKIGAWLTKGGRRNALDDFCDFVGSVVTRRGQ
jgi:hypothetical protein